MRAYVDGEDRFPIYVEDHSQICRDFRGENRPVRPPGKRMDLVGS